MSAIASNLKNRIFVSTGGFRDIPGDLAMIQLAECGITSIELSGGKYSSEIPASLLSRGQCKNFHFHNYFPVPENPFVLNLASSDDEISEKSISHVRRAIDESVKFGINNYSFHAGFLLDPKPKELGKVFQKANLSTRSSALNLFLDRVNSLAEYAAKFGVQLLIENNVVTKDNLNRFGCDPFLLTNPSGANELIEGLNPAVGILLDVAHLKVSANTLSFQVEQMFDAVNSRVKAYHLSDNDGLSDSNQSVSVASYFWKFLKWDVLHYTLEVYGLSFSDYINQVELVEKMIGKNANT